MVMGILDSMMNRDEGFFESLQSALLNLFFASLNGLALLFLTNTYCWKPLEACHFPKSMINPLVG